MNAGVGLMATSKAAVPNCCNADERQPSAYNKNIDEGREAERRAIKIQDHTDLRLDLAANVLGNCPYYCDSSDSAET
jgi:hypothetical protein